MEEEISLQNLDGNDVLSFDSTMFKVDKLREEVNGVFYEYKLGEQLTKSFSAKNLPINVGGESRSRGFHWFYNKWFSDGIDCEILKIGAKGWLKGKVKINLKITLEFCPDEPEVEEIFENNKLELQQLDSSLDNIRQMINQDS